MEGTRNLIRNIIYGAVGLISAVLILRIIFDLAQAGNNVFLKQTIVVVSDFFSYPFRSIINVSSSALVNLNADAVVSLLIYIVLGYLITKVVTGFLYDTLYDIVQNFVDGIFKILEFIIILRIIFQLFAVLPTLSSSAFVDAVYSWTNWTQSLLFRIPFGSGYIDLSALLWLGIIIIFDIFSGRYLAKVLGGTVVIASASTNALKFPKIKLPSLKRQSGIHKTSEENKPKEVYIDLPPQKTSN